MRRSEILRRKDDIDRVFSLGRKHHEYPLTMLAYSLPSESPTGEAKVLFSVPKRRFKRAVMRNRIKRQMREAFRLNRSTLGTQMKLHLVLIYSGAVPVTYQELEAKIIVLLGRLTPPDEEAAD